MAGMLMFGVNPGRYLTQSGIMFAHFNGNEPSDELIDRQEINGSLPRQVDAAVAVIKNNILRPSIIEGHKRKDTSIIPPDKVFREVVVNACVHRNYAITGSQIRICMFDNRIECISPGRLPNTVTVEKLRSGVSYATNPVLVKFMDNLRYIDRLGVCRS
jgi:ATP-dependent DNA helicase RecG